MISTSVRIVELTLSTSKAAHSRASHLCKLSKSDSSQLSPLLRGQGEKKGFPSLYVAFLLKPQPMQLIRTVSLKEEKKKLLLE